MPLNNDSHRDSNTQDFLPKMVTVFRHLLFSKEVERKKNGHIDSAQKIMAWVDSAEQQQIELERKKIRDELIKDGGATQLHNNSQSLQ
ncbi:MAG: hypothetical protein K0R98_247 [Rickettsiaceae bacterium]|jgi:hypothetical protein|nr:hypothetical protein [Rickettsiaceae bacterium]